MKGGSPAATHAGGHAGVPEGQAQGRVPRWHTRQRACGCAGWEVLGEGPIPLAISQAIGESNGF